MRMPYTLSIDSNLKPFLPEINYVLSILERYYPLRRCEKGDANISTLHYGSSNSTADIVIPSVLFPQYIIIKQKGGIFLSENAKSYFHSNNTSLFPSSLEHQENEKIISFDALGLIFFMLSRIEERDFKVSDSYNRYPAMESLAFRAGLNAVPLVDSALELIASRLLKTRRPDHLSNYEVVPTHDVDMLKSYHRRYEPLRYACGDIIKRGQPFKGLRRLVAYVPIEPKRSFNRLMSLSEKYGVKSHFYFMAPSEHRMDSTYAILYPALLRAMALSVRERGHYVGYHPGYNTFDNMDEWERQKTSLEKILSMVLKEGRQHVLRYAVDCTPRIWNNCGMKTDYTLAFPEKPGFRTGSTRCFSAYDLIERKVLNIDLCATSVMDFSLFGGKYQDLSINEAIEECKPIISACRRYSGRLVILQHTGSTSIRVNKFYNRLLKEAA